MTEADIQARFLLAVGALPGVRLFRNTVGEGWQGEVTKRTPNSVTLLNPRYVKFGLAPGSADLIGWHHGRFLAAEIKSRTGRFKTGQQNFLSAVRAAGGLAETIRDPIEGFDWIQSCVS